MTKEQLEQERQRLMQLHQQALAQVMRIEGAIALCNDMLKADGTAVPQTRAERRRKK